ncbi:serine/threonine-protein kinase [Halomonas sp. H10-9-1]|uniref:serine/threonine protein kinase n=1 Tax=Halomonas sp. H10-9-1 TaxID=2950871 RepID=UPI0032E0241C
MSLEQIGKYELIKHLGNGAFGDVYLAHDHALDTQKAIKILNAPDASDAIKKLEEAQILHKCMHKNIVHINEANIYDINSSPHVIIDMEYLPRGSFEDAIKNNSVSIHTTLRIIVDCLFALEHAHINGILHRDVKPANIMLCDFGAKLSDFGLATVLGLQAAGSPQGYTTHLPPEYFVNRNTTELTDVFAVGITLFRACNYISDWNGAIRHFPDPMSLIHSGQLVNSLGFAPFVPLKLKRIINKACASNPTQRYQSAAEFRQAIGRLSPKIDWVPNGQSSFEGVCTRTNASYSIALAPTRSSFNVEFKKNNRKQSSECRSFSNFDDASKYLFGYVSSSLFE